MKNTPEYIVRGYNIILSDLYLELIPIIKRGERLLQLPPTGLSHLILKHMSLVNAEDKILASVEVGSDPAFIKSSLIKKTYSPERFQGRWEDLYPLFFIV